ncbi:nuclear transport factor 2 family protein [Streptomyces sp. WAC06614]|uniref:nuclear transport factor 2 family protein n=1 Tax=Streptomyces sp. WAC06614 TaxID=2487416 RepID=UPI000F78DA29|nr:nuclear transport factor 2 family protein [Streptomyces sp. WAC06614]RSS81800.1 nuclear transport factor 2 family protein [Streptomyces sp. WAC06614]
MAAQGFTEDAIRGFAEKWYVALDQHVELAQVLEFITEDLEFKVPEDTFLGHEGFSGWYEAVTHRFFDEVHTVTKVEPVIEGDKAVVRVLVNWQARIWDPPAARSVWLGFDADQTWVVVPGPQGPRISRYTVNELAPMPGSASL